MARAVDALSRREYSRLELTRRLMRSLAEGETFDDVEDVVGTLEKRGYLSDERYAQTRVRVRSERYGNRRLAHELRMMGVDGEIVRETLANAPDEFERAMSVWQKRFGKPPQDRRERDRQVRFLASRGFAFDIIERCLRAVHSRVPEDDEDGDSFAVD